MAKFKYKLSIFLTVTIAIVMFLGIIAAVYGGTFWQYMYDHERLNQAVTQVKVDSLKRTTLL